MQQLAFYRVLLTLPFGVLVLAEAYVRVVGVEEKGAQPACAKIYVIVKSTDTGTPETRVLSSS